MVADPSIAVGELAAVEDNTACRPLQGFPEMTKVTLTESINVV
jgi:hypothetical protein